MGHLHAGCSKEVIVTFSSSKAVTLSQLQMRCKVCQVEFQQPVEEVADWDDRHKMVHWLSSSEKASDASKQAVKDKVHVGPSLLCYRDKWCQMLYKETS